MAKQVPVPDELKILIPEPEVVVVGEKAYEIFPLFEGQLEQISKDFSRYFAEVFNADRKCSKCGKVIKDAVVKGIDECPVATCKAPLDDLRKSQIDAILGGGKIPEWIQMITDVPKEEVAKVMTFNQMRHFAAVFWKQNFDDTGLPEESRRNFRKLLGLMGLGTAQAEEKKPETKSPPQAS